MVQGRMKVKVSSGVLKKKTESRKVKKQNVKTNSGNSSITTTIHCELFKLTLIFLATKKKKDRKDGMQRLTTAINNNIEKIVTDRALKGGSHLNLIKKPKEEDIKDRRMKIMKNVLSRVANEFGGSKKSSSKSILDEIDQMEESMEQ